MSLGAGSHPENNLVVGIGPLLPREQRPSIYKADDRQLSSSGAGTPGALACCRSLIGGNGDECQAKSGNYVHCEDWRQLTFRLGS